MTRRTTARVAGITFLVYIAVAVPCLVLMSRAIDADGLAAKLARVGDHATEVRVSIVLTLLSCFCAILLGVTLYGLTREVDRDLALMTLAFRLAEGALGAVGIPSALARLWLATSPVGEGAPDVATRAAIGTLLLDPPQDTMLGAPFFAVGSLVFAWLLLRGRLVPTALAWLGIAASAFVVVVSPLQVAGFLHGPLVSLQWLPMLAFELVLAIRLIAKGVPAPPALASAAG